MVSAVVGLNWGDEGKGRVVDYLAADADCVIRYQGGDNAGHTIVNSLGRFALHNFPSGIFNRNCLNIIAAGSVVNPESFVKERNELDTKGVDTGNLVISDRATLVFPFHLLLDRLEEERLKDKKYGSTQSGIAPVYGLKFLKKGIQAGELLHPRYLQEHMASIMEYVNLLITGVYGDAPVNLDDVMGWLECYSSQMKPVIRDTAPLVEGLLASRRKIVLEAQLGALRDINHGIYPYSTSSSTLAAFACASVPLPPAGISEILGVTKAYSTCVGEGPFVTEMDAPLAGEIRDKAGEYGAKTGRPRRIGHFDAVATAYGCKVQGATAIALTCLDVLSDFRELKICIGYKTPSGIIRSFPINPVLYESEPVYEAMEGWQEDITQIRRFADLPANARKYVERISVLTSTRIGYVSVGPERDAIIPM